MNVKSAPSLHSFFQEAVSSAIRNQGIEASEMTEFYVVNLLADFAHTPPSDEALALKVCRGLQEGASSRMQKLREVGDTSLFVSGFFPDSLNRSLIDVDYYIGMGELAYGHLAHAGAASRGALWREVFAELADNFKRFVAVLAEISSDSAVGSPANILRLYEKYLKTGSESVLEKLRRRGFVVRRGTVH